MPPRPLDRLCDGHPDAELIDALEPDQVAAAASQPLPHYAMSRTVRIALWVLRLFALLTTALVVYTFVAGLRAYGLCWILCGRRRPAAVPGPGHRRRLTQGSRPNGITAVPRVAGRGRREGWGRKHRQGAIPVTYWGASVMAATARVGVVFG